MINVIVLQRILMGIAKRQITLHIEKAMFSRFKIKTIIHNSYDSYS